MEYVFVPRENRLFIKIIEITRFDLCDGVIGYAFEGLKFPIAPIILGLVLDEKAGFNFRTALKIGYGDWTVLVTNSSSIGLASLTMLVLFHPLWQNFGRKRKDEPSRNDSN